ncbi:MAG: cytidylate kinase-like family protein [Acidobacteria bacterium]|nr:cytidylate kinase-like family protein [Acidobacteriota bacterium]
MGRKLYEGVSGFDRLIERQMLLREKRNKLVQHRMTEQGGAPYRFITISRDVGTGGDGIAAELAGRLEWKLYDREIVEFIARESNVLRELVEQLDEEGQSRVNDSVEQILSIFQRPGFGNDQYHVALLHTLSALAEQGECIILGHGGAYALQGQPGLHVRITAPVPARVRRMSREWRLPPPAARRAILRRDQNRREFIQHHFMVDRDDPRFFDIVVNTDRMGSGAVVAAILGIIEESRGVMSAAIPAPLVARQEVR